MSGPLPGPGPMRPPTNDAKFNVTMYYAMAALVATVGVATLTPGLWRLLAIPFGILAAALIVAAFRHRLAAAESHADGD